MTAIRPWAIGILATLAWTLSAAQTQSVTVDIKPQPARAALRQFGEQTGLQVSFRADEVASDVQVLGVQGELPAGEALTRLLEKTGLTYEFVNERTVRISAAAAVSVPAKSTSAENIPSGTRLAQSTQNANSPSATAGNQADTASANRKSKADAPERLEAFDVGSIPEILVVGRKTLNVDLKRTQDDAQPYQVFDRQAIERSSARTVEDFLRQKLTASSGYESGSQDNVTGVASNVSNVSLRGLGSFETLVLIDGRRSAAYPTSSNGEGQPNLNGIPISAIERIEVLPSSAAGIYGGNAVGGVINVILRRDYSGVEARATYESPFSGSAAQRQLELTAGLSLESGRTNILFAGVVSDSDPLFGGDRDYAQRYRNYLLTVAPEAIYNNFGFAEVPLGATANIHSVSGANLTLKGAFGGASVGSPFTHLPAGYAGIASDDGAALIANAGEYNLDLAHTAELGGTRRQLLSAPKTKAANASIRRTFTDSLDAFLKVMTSKTTTQSIGNPGSFFFLSEVDPGNPFNEPVIVSTPAYGIDLPVESETNDLSIGGGLVFRLPGNWAGNLDFGWSRSRLFSESDLGRYDLLAARAAASNGTIDVFRDARGTSDLTQFLLADPDTNGPGRNTLRTLSAHLGGPMPFYLPGGGRPVLSALLERREEHFGEYRSTLNIASYASLFPEQSRTVNGAYAELLLPFIGAANSLPGVNLLELQVAGRWDEYENDSGSAAQSFGGAPFPPIVRSTSHFSSVNPSIALRYKPIPDIAVRASYGTAYRPPSFSLLVPGNASFAFTPALTDPLRGGEPLGEVTYSFLGGNPGLDPEKSTSLAIGMIVTPNFAPGLRLAADWTRIRKHDAFGGLDVLGSQVDLNRMIETFPEHVIRAAPGPGETVGPIVALDSLTLNISRAEVEALDLTGDYTVETAGFGRFTVSTRATKLLRVESQFTSDYPVDNDLGITGTLEWRANASLTWERNNWTADWSARYYDSYFANDTRTDVAVVGGVLIPGTAKVPSQIFHDLFASYRFDAGGVEIQAGVKNIFNARPAFNAALPASSFASPFGDVRRAVYHLSLRKAF